MKTAWAVAYGIVCGLLGAGLLFLLSRQPAGAPIQLQPPPTTPPILIHVTGAVLQPGVYALPAGSRVQDAVQAAGGFSPEADTQALNLAAFVQDGGRIFVPRLATPTLLLPPAAGNTTPMPVVFPININTAELSELEALPGIGPEIAQAVITYRQEHGAFQTLQGIIDVPGIGPGIFKDIKDLITLGEIP